MPVLRINREGKDSIQSGYLKYKDIDFIFVVDGAELKLIPPLDKEEIVIKMASSLFSNPNKRFVIEEDYLIGDSKETQEYYIFIPAHNKSVSFLNSTMFIPLLAYIVKYDDERISQIVFSSNELNYIFLSSEGINDMKTLGSGAWRLEIKPFAKTQSEPQTFFYNTQKVKVQFCISRNLDRFSLGVSTVMVFSFDPTFDYKFIYDLSVIANNFINYCCYRKNTELPKSILNSPTIVDVDNSYVKSGEFILLEEQNSLEQEIHKGGRYINLSHLEGNEGRLLANLASDTIYIDHIPLSTKEERTINAARFLMITAAFEWEYNRVDKLFKDDEQYLTFKKVIKEREDVKKKHFSLGNKIDLICNYFENIIQPFSQRLYKINSEEFDSERMGERIRQQRNNFAHGNLSKDFEGLSLLDLVLLQQIIYVMQLKIIGVSDGCIMKIINELFQHRLIL